MSHFPEPIQLPDDVLTARQSRNKQVLRAAGLGISIRTTIILIELIGVYAFGSSALLMDALSSVVDVVSTLFLILCIKLAERPPDKEHPFGHGRYEPLVGLQLGLLLVVIGGGMLFQQTFQLSQPVTDTVIDKRTWIFSLVALVLLEISYQVVMRTAKRQRSPALAADAVHYRIDGITSLFATIALLVAAYFPQWSVQIDHLGAISIAILMIGIGLYAARGNLDQIMDKVPDQDFFNQVRDAAAKVIGVLGTEKIRIQLYGPDAHVDIDVEVDPQMPVEAAHTISQKVRIEIQKAWPAVRDVTVHIEPFYPGDH